MTVPATKTFDPQSHVNQTSKARQASPLKSLFNYMFNEGMVSFAGGLPHPSFFPFQNLSLGAYPHTANLAIDAPPLAEDELLQLTVQKYGSKGNDLATALQYGAANGHPTLMKYCREFTDAVFTPARSDYEQLLNNGNTDAWTKVVRLLCNPGDHILTEEYTFPSAQGVWIPLGIKAAPVKMDEDGMRADDLRRVLSEWEQNHAGVPRPRLMYIVPVGSNPTGSTMPARRRQEIYQICAEFDVVICEDDPYSFLQFEQYELGTDSSVGEPKSAEEFKASLVPSFLKFDTDGRVIRLDTFSKTIAPGSRVGYFTAHPVFIERLVRATEVETQAASGWSQIILSELLGKWGIDGFLHWLSNLREQYRARRDQMCNAIGNSFDVRPASETTVAGAEGLVAFAKGTEIPVFSFVPPTGGMFIWCRFYLTACPRFATYSKQADPEQAFMADLWKELAENHVLLVPGGYYSPWQGENKTTTFARGEEQDIGYFRLAYSMTTKEEMETGIERMTKVLMGAWGL